MKTNQSSIQEAALFYTLCAFIALAACSKPGSKDAGHDSDAPLQGTLLLTGSSTMAPLISDIAKRFELAHPNVQITVKTGGSMRGVQDAREGVADIGMASRALTDAESDLSGLPMARDGICLLGTRIILFNLLPTRKSPPSTSDLSPTGKTSEDWMSLSQ